MFGQDPQLPCFDFLLGRVQEPVPGHPHDWIVEHQTRLRHAFESTTRHLEAAAARRKEHYDKHVCDAPLQGQLVLLKDTSVRGRHKIQDIWSSTVYKVLKAPGMGGSVYTVALVHNPQQVKHLHREPPEQMGSISADSSFDSDWAVVTSEPMAVPRNHLPARPVTITFSPNQTDAVATSQPSEGPVHSTTSTEIPSTSEASLRTTRPNAGRHPNLPHLPQVAGSSAIGATNSLMPVLSGCAVFRPLQ